MRCLESPLPSAVILRVACGGLLWKNLNRCDCLNRVRDPSVATLRKRNLRMTDGLIIRRLSLPRLIDNKPSVSRPLQPAHDLALQSARGVLFQVQPGGEPHMTSLSGQMELQRG